MTTIIKKTKNGEKYQILIDEDQFTITANTMNGDEIGAIIFSEIEYPNGSSFLITNLNMDRLMGNI